MTKWEYKTLVFIQKNGFFGYGGFQDNEVIEKKLDELGQSGWELMSSVPNAVFYGRTNEVLMIFKRQAQ